MKKYFLYAQAILVIGVLGSVVLSQSAAAVIGGIGGRPAPLDPDSPRSKSIFTYTLDTGKQKRDAVIVTNHTSTEQVVELYPTDAVVTNTGSFSCKQRVEDRRDIGSWIALSSSAVTLQPGESRTVPFIITTPATADVGEHNGCLAFETKGDEGQVQGNVRIRTRSAIRVAVTIPGALHRDVMITSFDVSATDTTQTFRLSLKSSGNVSTDTATRVVLRTLFGSEVYRNGGRYPVLASNKLDLNFVNDHPPFWGGWYVAQASISYDKQVPATNSANSKQPVTKYSDQRMVFVTPSAAAIMLYCLILLLLLGGAAYYWYRYREKKDARANWQRHAVRDGESLQSLAQSRAVSWRRLAKTNNLKAPYTLRTGDTILLPRNNANKKRTHHSDTQEG